MVITKYDDYLLEQLLNESMVNEKINIDKIKEIVKKVGNKKESIKNLIKRFNQTNNITLKKVIGAVLIVLMVGNFLAKNNKWARNNFYQKELEKSVATLIDKSTENGELTMDMLNEIDAVSYVDALPEKNIISIGTPGLIEDVNKVKPGRLDTLQIDHYDQYDKEILDALKELEDKGETPNADLIKIIMVIETGMNPVKNKLGYEGFPQTKNHIINGWTDKKGNFHPGVNQKHGTNFTMADMYDPGKSAQFIYYYLKSLNQSDNVESIPDILIAYNWGVGNLGKYKRGDKELPKQSSDYISMYNAIVPHLQNVPTS